MTHMNSFISFDTPVRLSTTRRPGPISIPVYVLYPPICPMLRTGCSWASYTRYGNDEFITPARGDKCFATRHPFPSFKLIGCERLQLTKANIVNFPTAVTHLSDSKLSPRQSVAKQRQFLAKKLMFQWGFPSALLTYSRVKLNIPPLSRIGVMCAAPRAPSFPELTGAQRGSRRKNLNPCLLYTIIRFTPTCNHFVRLHLSRFQGYPYT